MIGREKKIDSVQSQFNLNLNAQNLKNIQPQESYKQNEQVQSLSTQHKNCEKIEEIKIDLNLEKTDQLCTSNIQKKANNYLEQNLNNLQKQAAQLQLNQQKSLALQELEEKERQKQYLMDLQIEDVDINIPYHADLTIKVLRQPYKNNDELKFLVHGASLNWLNKSFKLKTYPKYHTIFKQGTIGTTYYIILKGKVACMIKDENQQDGNQKKSDQINQNDSQNSIKECQKFQDSSPKNSKNVQSLRQYDEIKKEDFNETKLNQQNTGENKFQQVYQQVNIMNKFNQNNKNENKQFVENNGDDQNIMNSDSNKKFFQFDQNWLNNQSEQTVLNIILPNFKKIFEFKTGQAFGEIALMTNSRRTASMVCTEQTYCMELNKSGYDKIIGSYQKMLAKDKIKFFRKYDFFQNIPDSKLLSTIQSIQIQKLQAKTQIYKEGDICDKIYFVKKGEIEFSRFLELEKVHNEKSKKKFENCQEVFTENERLLQKLNYNSTLKKKKEINQRKTLMYLSTGSYFGDEEVNEKTNIRKSRAVVKSLECELYEIPIDFFLNILKGTTNFQTFQTGQKKQKDIEINRQLLMEDVLIKTDSNYTNSISQMQLKNININQKRDIDKFRHLNDIKKQIQSKNHIQKKNHLKQYISYPNVQDIPIPIRFTSDRNFKQVEQQLNTSFGNDKILKTVDQYENSQQSLTYYNTNLLNNDDQQQIYNSSVATQNKQQNEQNKIIPNQHQHKIQELDKYGSYSQNQKGQNKQQLPLTQKQQVNTSQASIIESNLDSQVENDNISLTERLQYKSQIKRNSYSKSQIHFDTLKSFNNIKMQPLNLKNQKQISDSQVYLGKDKQSIISQNETTPYNRNQISMKSIPLDQIKNNSVDLKIDQLYLNEDKFDQILENNNNSKISKKYKLQFAQPKSFQQILSDKLQNIKKLPGISHKSMRSSLNDKQKKIFTSQGSFINSQISSSKENQKYIEKGDEKKKDQYQLQI
ncbi:Cyclic nucleotide-binding protein [Pseudocohnilembus persalinus]|uniref:Cyclic nucleotide-binding protein n=1 Tax=Pseudocohnilembus persalinus TaxID=266149 RepID=A0A0V0R312_PSEPJ|nr:Cyclic nucleotide-binding protein [Pseudocohnilembus persalinus]|eukprot:KRX08672.1 Cyclic nucleotide-binding protein [Pseudocohnilembus persalinus]